MTRIRTQRPDRWGVTAAPLVRPRYQARKRRTELEEAAERLMSAHRQLMKAAELLMSATLIAGAVWLFLVTLFVLAP